MLLKDLIQKLVETEEIDKRMEIVEEHSSIIEETPEAEKINSENLSRIKELEEKIEAEKKKYRDRFFSSNNTDDVPDNKETETNETKFKTLDELLSYK